MGPPGMLASLPTWDDGPKRQTKVPQAHGARGTHPRCPPGQVARKGRRPTRNSQGAGGRSPPAPGGQVGHIRQVTQSKHEGHQAGGLVAHEGHTTHHVGSTRWQVAWPTSGCPLPAVCSEIIQSWTICIIVLYVLYFILYLYLYWYFVLSNPAAQPSAPAAQLRLRLGASNPAPHKLGVFDSL